MHLKHCPTSEKTVDLAHRLADAGLSVLPVRKGAKQPAIPEWKSLQSRIAGTTELDEYFSDPNHGLAVVTGSVSGNLEVIDFDCGGEMLDAWIDLIEELQPGLAEQLLYEQTPSGGFHAIYRCEEAVEGNQKLATQIACAAGEEGVVIGGKLRKAKQVAQTGEWISKAVSIETRGEGGYCVFWPTSSYRLLCGDPTNIPVLTAKERRILLSAARSLNEDVDREDVELKNQPSAAPHESGERPGDEFNRRGCIRRTLQAHGWRRVREGTNEHWCRPGKEEGTSATLKAGVFYVFSSNAHPFAPCTHYSPFAVYSLLEHQGNYAAAASKLRTLGYGGPNENPAGDDPPPGKPPDEQACGPLLPISATELIRYHPELNPPLIHGLLRRGETLNLIASPKVGKSFLSLALAISVASGRPWLGRFDTEAGRVLIVDNELHRSTSAQRIKLVVEALGIDSEKALARVDFIHMRGELADIHSLQSTFAQIGSDRYGLVILDAFYRFLPVGTSENDNAQIAAVYNRVDQYAAMLGSAFALVHHTTKGSQSDRSVTDVGAGAGAQSRAADTHVVLRPHEDDDVVVLDAVVRSWPPTSPVCLKWQFPVWAVANSLDPTKLKKTRSGKNKGAAAKAGQLDEPLWTTESFVDRFISEEPVGTAEIREKAKGEPGLSWRRVSDLLEIAVRQDLVHRWQIGKSHKVLYATVPQPVLGKQAGS